MAEYSKIAASVGDQCLDALAETQENLLKSLEPVSQWASSVKVPEASGPAADFPTLQEITEANFAFTTKLLKQQKKFTDKIIAAYAPAKS